MYNISLLSFFLMMIKYVHKNNHISNNIKIYWKKYSNMNILNHAVIINRIINIRKKETVIALYNKNINFII